MTNDWVHPPLRVTRKRRPYRTLTAKTLRAAGKAEVAERLEQIQAASPVGAALVRLYFPRGVHLYSLLEQESCLDRIEAALNNPDAWAVNAEGMAERYTPPNYDDSKDRRDLFGPGG